MRFASFIAAGIFALTATAQTTTTTAVSGVTTTSTGAAATDSTSAVIQACLSHCDASDVDCKAHCIAVPSPDTSSVNATTQCVAACPQGNGTAADNTAYGKCVDGCINQYFYSTSVGTPQTTAQGSGSGSGSGSTVAVVSAVVSTITSGSSTITTTIGSTTIGSTTLPASASKTGTGSSASATSSNAADAVFRPMGSSVGLLGFLAALLAL